MENDNFFDNHKFSLFPDIFLKIIILVILLFWSLLYNKMTVVLLSKVWSISQFLQVLSKFSISEFRFQYPIPLYFGTTHKLHSLKKFAMKNGTVCWLLKNLSGNKRVYAHKTKFLYESIKNEGKIDAL